MDFQYYLQQVNQNLDLGSERSHYYALKSLIDNALIGINAIIEEKGNQAGIPDFTVRKNDSLIGYIEAKKIGEDLNKIQESEQLKRYFDSSIGQNLILTNFLEFRLFRDGKLHLFSTLGKLKNNQIVFYQDFTKTTDLINNFVNFQEKTINNYLDLAQQMAIYTKSVKYAIEESLKIENETGELTKLKATFTDLLLPDLDDQNFADMYAQTIAYGLFTARFFHEKNSPLQKTVESPLTPLQKGGIADSPLSKGGGGGSIFNRQNISRFLNNKIPFLQGLFNTVIKTDIINQIDWVIDNLIELFAKVDMDNILTNFGQETKREDPVVHFYETFLGAYSQDLRKGRGVYYTPESVVSFIVKAVNDILDQDFNLQDGLGNRDVIILDPATGTGTFLYQVIKQICDNYSQYSSHKWEHNWQKYFKDRKVLERLFGFELLITPYTIAHLKLQLLLENLGYKFTDNERLNIFLTNTLDQGIKKSETLLAEYITQEANRATEIKKKTLIHVVMGNPPYSGNSANKNSWINESLKDYYIVDDLPLNEKNSKWLKNDYVKFIRFGQAQIDQTGLGILAFITPHNYIDNPTFPGMRQNLMKSFSRIFILNLHGNINKKEVTPDDSKDENVFDIKEGVSILIAIKDISQENLKFLRLFNSDYKIPEKGIYYYDLWGSRDSKYKLLKELTMKTIEWEKVNPVSPFYLFTPQDDLLREEYNNYYKITDIMPVNVLGFQTHRDDFAIDFDKDKLYQRIKEMRNNKISDQEYLEKYNLKESQTWQIKKVRKLIKNNKEWEKPIITCLYRPFDIRYCYFSNLIIDRPRRELINHVEGKDNLCLLASRQQATLGYRHCFVADLIPESCVISTTSKEGNQVFPLYLYPNKENGQDNLMTEREANFSDEFLTVITEKLGYLPTPENIFYYIYAILHCPEYRYRYESLLKIDFPRIPLTSNNELFTQLITKGEELVNLHLLKKLPDITITKNETLATVNLPLFNEKSKGTIHYQGDGKNEIKTISYNPNLKRILINQDCYFIGISEEVWQFKIGGYQILDKWLKDRKKANLNLSSEDITHYQKIIVILIETIKIMTEIDQIIPNFPII